jgi:hypothetical protein
MRDSLVGILVFGIVVVAVILIVVAGSRGMTAIRELLRSLATSAGWTDLRNAFMVAAGVKGTWRSFPVALSYMGRQKGTPQRLILNVGARSDSRLIIKRRFTGLFNRPLTWFGPPLIELRHSSAEELWVRADEPTLAERLFGDSSLAALMGTNLVARFDEIRIDRGGLRLTRALDDRLVKEKYGMATFAFRPDTEKLEPIAREELALAEALVNKLSMMS